MGWPYQQKPPMAWPIDLDSSLLPNAGFWPMLEGSGGQVFDLSGNGNTGTVSGAIWKPAKYGSGLDFVTDDYVLIENLTNSFQQPFTAIGTIEFDTLTADRALCSALGEVFMVWMDFASPCHFAFGIFESEPWDVGYGDIIPVVGQYYQLGITYDGAGTARLYVDGKQDGADLSSIVSGDATTIHIGASTSTTGKNHDGIIDHFLLYNRALTASEIALLYREPFCMFKDPAEMILATAGQVAPTGVVPQLQMLRHLWAA